VLPTAIENFFGNPFLYTGADSMSEMLSVIIPTYNRANYVKACLASLQQCGYPHLELIVSDDGSTDETREVVTQNYRDVHYLWQPNSGTPATARNRGFQASQGKYVAFLDCDDAWLTGAASQAVECLRRHSELDVLFANAHMGNPEQGYISWIQTAGQEEFWTLPWITLEKDLRIFERKPFLHRMAVRNPVFIGACIMRREAFEKIGQFDATLCGAADWELWLRLATQFTFGYLDIPLALYTRHLDNMSSDFDAMGREFCQSLINVLQKCDLARDDQQFLQERLRHLLFGHAYLAYDRGNVTEARTRFWKAIQAGNIHPKTWAYWLGCHLPQPVVRRIRAWKQIRTQPTH
jgi:glycosyltransferase involved in cell wall biosynthesis